MSNASNTNRYIFNLNKADYFTLLSLITGFLAIFLLVFTEYIFVSFALLFYAMILDAMDGYIARKNKLVRNFGIAFDSFVDTVNYLIAPCIVLFVHTGKNPISLIVFFVYFTTGIIRLSVFNNIQFIDDEASLYYLGLPVFWSLHVIGILLIIDTVLIPILPFASWIILPILSYLFVYKRKWKKITDMKRIFITSIILSLLLILLEGY